MPVHLRAALTLVQELVGLVRVRHVLEVLIAIDRRRACLGRPDWPRRRGARIALALAWRGEAILTRSRVHRAHRVRRHRGAEARRRRTWRDLPMSFAFLLACRHALSSEARALGRRKRQRLACGAERGGVRPAVRRRSCARWHRRRRAQRAAIGSARSAVPVQDDPAGVRPRRRAGAALAGAEVHRGRRAVHGRIAWVRTRLRQRGPDARTYRGSAAALGVCVAC